MFVLFQALFNEADYTVTINQHHSKTSRFHEVAPWKRCDNILFNILTKTERAIYGTINILEVTFTSSTIKTDQ